MRALVKLLPVLVLLSLSLWVYFSKPEYVEILPNEYDIKLWPWAETISGDSSKIVSFENSDHGVTCTYILHENAPYAGFTIGWSKSKTFDAGEYTYLEVEFDESVTKKARLTLSYFLDGFSDFDDWRTYLIGTHDFHSIGNKKYLIPFKELTTPNWWYSENNVDKDTLSVNDYSKLVHISFVNGEGQEAGSEKTLAIKSVRFIKEKSYVAAIVFMLLIPFYCVMVFWVFRKKNHNTKFSAVKIAKDSDKKFSLIMDYFQENYKEKGLTLSSVSHAIGLKNAEVTSLLKLYRDENFSQFLNYLRICEAKKLLQSTDLNVAEISSIVGYGYVNSFNRLFKEIEGMTPLEYRKKMRKE